MKLLVFAHTPPPHHGQSYMVQLMLAGFGGDRRKHRHKAVPANAAGATHGIECYHVNTRLSKQLEDIGEIRGTKLFLLLAYCLEAVWCRLRYGVPNLYYIPAPGKRSAVYRDWLVMFLCRPFFKRVILHWHASGMAKWLETCVQIRSRWITYQLARQADLSIVLSNYGRADAEKLLPLSVKMVGNGIPDPCPEFWQEVLPARQARLGARLKLLNETSPKTSANVVSARAPLTIEVLYMAHCTREKGLFETVEGILLANQKLVRQNQPVRLSLTVTGSFATSEDKADFDQVLARPEAQRWIRSIGFVSGDQKRTLCNAVDLFCFPSHLESFGLVLAEAMAYGLPVVTTRCGAMPEVMPPDYLGLVDVRAPDQVADALLRMMRVDNFATLRQRFETHFTLDRHLAALAGAIKSVEHTGTASTHQPAALSAAWPR